jgi:hypothetical protein
VKHLEKNNLENKKVDGKIILKTSSQINRMGGGGMDWINFALDTEK